MFSLRSVALLLAASITLPSVLGAPVESAELASSDLEKRIDHPWDGCNWDQTDQIEWAIEGLFPYFFFFYWHVYVRLIDSCQIKHPPSLLVSIHFVYLCDDISSPCATVAFKPCPPRNQTPMMLNSTSFTSESLLTPDSRKSSLTSQKLSKYSNCVAE
jgi:hypothetical protein